MRRKLLGALLESWNRLRKAGLSDKQIDDCLQPCVIALGGEEITATRTHEAAQPSVRQAPLPEVLPPPSR